MRATLAALHSSASAVLARAADFCQRYDLLPILLTTYVCTFFFFNDDVVPRRIYYYIFLPIAALLVLPFAARTARHSTILWAAVGYLLFLGFAWFGQPDIPIGRLGDHARKSFLVLSFLIIVAFLAFERERFLERFFLVVAVAGAISALLNTLLFYPNPLDFAYIAATRLQTLVGLPGYVVSTSVGLTYAVLLVAALVILVSGRLPTVQRSLLTVAAAVLALALMLAQSRGAMLAAITGSLVLLLRPAPRKAKFLIVAGIVVACGLILASPAFQERSLDLSASDRPEIWASYLAMAAERPWLGYGMWSNIDTKLRSGLVHIHPHNLILSAQIRGGLFAALSMAALLGGALYWGFRAWRRTGTVLPLSLAVAVAVGGSIDHEILTTATAWPWVTFWLPIAICIAAELKVRQTSLPADARS